MTTQEQQIRHIKAWQASGLSQVAYCRDHGLNSKTFGNWLRVYRDVQKDNQRTSLIPVTIRTTTTPSDYLKLRCSGGHTLELPADVSPQWLGELLRCLD
ncbi:MAG: IS66 family insertion sequence element accessory protein TnpB [Burkholderiales bacterium]|nr:IS66 family insertion sequence element accessory protein TnpB [Burkholderiales bacterium]MDR4515881.1 IS66 family insertion sequence element accessory protein TnpB [Nitrosomonas sp.]MCP5246251.1 IS66 family insertion sequence element accessory protein TnpB [Burkholderiales bacterium]MDR4515985.1 IS66 family insertion sequence element accessory protein TnpB [Nitrosomonas sp.]MDR4516074.1 IS66 family insertion sequence element accessory protein TnpB [Nitrosomonas sp.]